LEGSDRRHRRVTLVGDAAHSTSPHLRS